MKTYQNAKTKTAAKLIWTDDEIAFLKANCNRMSNQELAKHLNCNEHAIINQLHKLNLKRASVIKHSNKSKKICDDFSDHEIALIKELFGKVDLLDLMEKMPFRTTNELYECAAFFNLGTKRQISNYIKTCIPYKE